MKLYIPTTSLNFNNILSTESISPKGFYASRGFGYSRWFSIPENDLDGAILLYESPAVLARPKSESEDHPLLIEIETDEDFPVAKKGIRYSKHSIYLNPWNTKFIFQNEKDKTVAYSLSDHSLETKMLRLYNNKIKVDSGQGLFPTLEGISIDSTIEDSCIERDRQINKIKGLLYGYYIGACLSSSKDDIEKINILKEIQNIFAAVVSSVERTPSNVQEERLGYLFTSYVKKSPLYQELLAEIENVDKTDHVLEILQKYGIKVFNWRKIVNGLQYNSNGSNDAISWIKSEISKLQKKMASCSKLLSPDAEEIVTSNGKISKVLSIVNNEENQLYVSWVNNILINFNGKVSPIRTELADAITKSARDTLGDKWTNSPIRAFLNHLRRHVRGEAFTLSWDNGVLSSIAAVISKGDDWENLLHFMQSKGMTDYRIAFSFYGILNGFANLTRDFTDILLNQKSAYVAEIYCEFYGQLHGITIDINKMSNIGSLKEKHTFEVQNAVSISASNKTDDNDTREQQEKKIWEFFNNSSAFPKSGNKKKKLEDGLHRCLNRYPGEVDFSQFIMDLNDFGDCWKKSNKPWKSMQEQFCPNYNDLVGQNKSICGKVNESLSLFEEVSLNGQQITQTTEKHFAGSTAQAMDFKQNMSHSIREEAKSHASRNEKSILKDTAWIDTCASMISDSRAKKQFVDDMKWFVGNHQETYEDKKKGVVKGRYAGHDCTNERVIERLKSYMDNKLHPRKEDMRWLADIYAKIPTDKIINCISEMYGI